MKCANHSERDATQVCGLCGNNFCEECLIRLGAADYCKECLEKKMKEGKVPDLDCKDAHAAIRSTDKKSRFWAFVFSLVPGVGYLYLGLMNRGLQTMALFFGTIFAASFINFEQLMGLVVPVTMFYSIFDTQQMVKSINSGEQVEDKQLFDFKSITINQSWIGYAFVVIGILALLNGVLPQYIPGFYVFRSFLPPLLVIGVGVLILYRSTRKVP